MQPDEPTASSRPRLLCLMGSGEMSPGMVGVHAELMRRVGSPPAPAALLDTPYGFQENADELTARAQNFFQNRVRRPIEVASLRRLDPADPLPTEGAYRLLAEAAYVFAGPGSPSYAVRHWRRSRVPTLLAERMATGGCVTLASAAAIAVGRLALPVYEIYKVGEPVHWIEGLDLLRSVGLDVVVITHYDNAEGGTHDTRYCYMGARRLAILAAQLPSELSIFGVAEHTAAIVDLGARTLEVRGRGFVAIRHDGQERQVRAGRSVLLEELGMAASTLTRPDPASKGGTSAPADGSALVSEAKRVQRRFTQAVEAADFDAALASVLALEAILDRGRGQSGKADSIEPVRSIFHEMLLGLAEAARSAAAGRQPIAQIVEVALRLRDEAREERRYPEADRLRDALLALGIEVHDKPVGSRSRA